MTATDEIASITALVPIGTGAQASGRIIPFKVYQHRNDFRAIPLVSTAEREEAGLPAELDFSWSNNSLGAAKGTKEATMALLRNIVQELRMQHIL